MSAADIAKRLGRSHPGVKGAIARLGIKPVQTVGRIRLYDQSEIGRIAEAMRQPNQNVPTV